MINISELIGQVLDDTDVTDPAEIAKIVADHVPAKDLRAVLAGALRSTVRDVMAHRRSCNPMLGGGSDYATYTQQQVWDRHSARSPKIAAIQTAWLRDRIHVGGAYRMLGECTYQDLVFAAQERRGFAEQNLARAEQLEKIAAAVAERGVRTVADLPNAVLKGLAR